MCASINNLFPFFSFKNAIFCFCVNRHTDGPKMNDSPNPVWITVTKGDPLNLNCSSVGKPSPTYTWTLPSANSSSYSGSVFTIDTVGFEDKGQYTCNVSNTAGTVTKEFHVVIKGEVFFFTFTFSSCSVWIFSI